MSTEAQVARAAGWSIGVLTLLVFALDAFTPLGMAVWLLYVLPLLVTLWLPGAHAAVLVAAACTLLLGAGFLLSPPGVAVWLALLNRGIGALALWVVALLLVQRRRAEAAIAQQRAALLEQESRARAESEAARQVLAAGERRLRAILDTEPECVKVVAEDGTLLDMNLAGLAIIEAESLEQVRGRSLCELVIPPHRPAFAELLRRTGRGESGVLEFEGVGLKGSHRWLEMRTAPLRNEREEVTGVLGITRDISERKQAEEALRASEAFSRQIVASAQECIIVLDRDLHYRLWNPFSEQITGLRAADVLGRHPVDVFPDLQGTAALALLHQALAGRTSVSPDTELTVPATGEQHWTSALITPLRTSAGDVDGVLLMVRNITDKKRAEDQVRELNRDLESRVIARTEELAAANVRLAAEVEEHERAEQALKQRTRQIAAANKELEAFSYSVSHDLRAPLRAVNGFAEILVRRQQHRLDDEGRHQLGNIVEASARMGQLIDDLLRYARLGRQGLESRPVPLLPVLARAAGDVAGRLEEAGGELELPKDAPIVAGEPTLLQQVFGNLLENAVTYRREGVPLRVRVSVESEGASVVVRVADNGIGIAPEHHEKIFRVFQRLHGTEEYPGTGVGLAIVQKAAGLLGGGAWVESAAGKGSTFCIRLPVWGGPQRRTEPA